MCPTPCPPPSIQVDHSRQVSTGGSIFNDMECYLQFVQTLFLNLRSFPFRAIRFSKERGAGRKRGPEGVEGTLGLPSGPASKASQGGEESRAETAYHVVVLQDKVG